MKRHLNLSPSKSIWVSLPSGFYFGRVDEAGCQLHTDTELGTLKFLRDAKNFHEALPGLQQLRDCKGELLILRKPVLLLCQVLNDLCRTIYTELSVTVLSKTTLPSTVQTEMTYCMSEVLPDKPFSITVIKKSSLSRR